VKLQRDDWDDDERRLVQDVGAELEQIRARHRGDPPFELLRAADAQALPEPLQEGIAEHLAQSAWSRALVGSGDDIQAALDPDAERRLLTRITRESRAARTPTARWWSWTWMPALAAAAVLVLAVVIFRRGGEPARPLDRPQPTPERQVASATPAAEFVLSLDKPDVKLTATALVLRSSGRNASFADEIAPAINAYRSSNYAEADKQFRSLEGRYPKSVEVAFYRGIAEIFLNDMAGAVQSLQAARRLDDETFAPDIAWYLAVAHERAGQRTRARAELEALCKGRSDYAPKACDAAQKIKPE
jgi:hypothetical protein